jgi:hypothetical protein
VGVTRSGSLRTIACLNIAVCDVLHGGLMAKRLAIFAAVHESGSHRVISLRCNDLSVFGAERPCVSHPPGPPFWVRTTFRNFTFCDYELPKRRRRMTRNETRTVPAHRPPDQLASGHRLRAQPTWPDALRARPVANDPSAVGTARTERLQQSFYGPMTPMRDQRRRWHGSWSYRTAALRYLLRKREA